MEEKIKSLKISSKVIAVITKIGYTVMCVAMALCFAMLIFLAITKGETSKFTIGKTNIIFFDALASSPAELAASCAVLIVMSALFFAIFFIAYRMFNEISLTGEPFSENYVKSIRIIGILTAIMPFLVGFVEFIILITTKIKLNEFLNDLPGMVVGAIIFCLSYIIDYGCELKKNKTTNTEQVNQ